MPDYVPDSSKERAIVEGRSAQALLTYHRAIRSGNLALQDYLTGLSDDNTEDIRKKTRENEIAAMVQNESLVNRIYNESKIKNSQLTRSEIEKSLLHMTEEDKDNLDKKLQSLSSDELIQYLKKNKTTTVLPVQQTTPSLPLPPKTPQKSSAVIEQITERVGKAQNLLDNIAKGLTPVKPPPIPIGKVDTQKGVQRKLIHELDNAESIGKLSDTDKDYLQSLMSLNEMGTLARKNTELKRATNNYNSNYRHITDDDKTKLSNSELTSIEDKNSNILQRLSKAGLDIENFYIKKANKYRNKLQPIISEEELEQKHNTISGSGVQSFNQNKIKFGDIYIDKRKLKKNILSLTTPNGWKVSGFVSIKVSDTFKNIILKSKLRQKHNAELTHSEQLLMQRLIDRSNAKLQPSKQRLLNKNCDELNDYKMKLLNDLQIIAGEIDAGNDSKYLKNELSRLTRQLFLLKVINRNQMKAIISDSFGEI